jgi:hypothetical protein
MDLCSKCNGFAERIALPSPAQYRDLARQLIQIVDEGTFKLTYADCPLSDLFDPTWPGDTLSHDFRCTTCGRLFHLHANTYHGGASWRPE